MIIRTLPSNSEVFTFVILLTDHHNLTVQLISFISAVILSITDLLRLDTGPVIAAEVAGLLLVKVEVERPPGLTGICADGV